MKRVIISALVAAVAMGMAAPAHAINFFRTYEAPGVTQTTAAFDVVGVETFNSRPVGTSTFTSNFGGTGVATGTFTDIQIINADQYGDVSGLGRYAVAFPGQTFTMSLSAPVNYFGFWLSALNSGNTVKFYSGNTLLQVYDAGNILDGIANFNSYLCNPTGIFVGHNCGEPYAFINFFAQNGMFDKVVFTQTAGGGLEADNFTVGRVAGTDVPEPAALGLLGAGLVLVAARRRRRRA